MRTSRKLKRWMDFFYSYSSDEDNMESRLTLEFAELRKIIEEIKLLEKKRDSLQPLEEKEEVLPTENKEEREEEKDE
jgi:hypothetical protein